MDLRLRRFEKGSSGIFSDLYDALGNHLCESCTHAYERADGQWEPKVPVGRWLCLRGPHSLDGVNQFETFSISVPGHVNILFHKGNVEEESIGCELLGMYKGFLDTHDHPHEEAVLDSKDAFDLFMKLQTGVQQFWLDVEDVTVPTDEVIINERAPDGSTTKLDDSIQRAGSSVSPESGHDPATGSDGGSVSSGAGGSLSLTDSLGIGGLA